MPAKKSISERGKEAAGNLKLREIFLLESHCCRAIDGAPGKAKVNVEYETDLLDQSDKSILAFACKYVVDALESEKEEMVVNLQITFCVIYGKVDAKVRMKKLDIDAFSKVNPVLNSWPYLREHVQNMIVKMAFPVLTLPPITIGEILGNVENKKH